MYRVLDLFSGIGGFSLGLERAGGFKTVAFCEIDPYCRKVLAKHWPGVPIYSDVRELTIVNLKSDGVHVDAICGGFPCQDISYAGSWNTGGIGIAGERSGLWSEYQRLICDLRPRYIFVENVSALLSRGLGVVLGDLAACGYDAEWHCIPACAVAAPHIRDRLWLVAYPQQVERVRPIFNGYDAAKKVWVETRKRDSNGFRSEVGGTSRSLPGKWMDQPKPERVAHGVSDWPHRLGALGNAVVPQIPELIGRAILQTEAEVA